MVTVETTSTSVITGAGLKKCIPTTSCGRLVAVAHEITGRLLVVVARIAPGLQISSRFSNSVVFTVEVLGDRLDHQVHRRQVVEAGRAGQVAERLRLGRLLELAALDRLVERPLDGGADRRRPWRPSGRRT